MANCIICNTVATERTTTKRGTAVVALHNDCAVLEDIQYWHLYADPTVKNIIQDKINRLALKKQGLPVGWP